MPHRHVITASRPGRRAQNPGNTVSGMGEEPAGLGEGPLRRGGKPVPPHRNPKAVVYALNKPTFFAASFDN